MRKKKGTGMYQEKDEIYLSALESLPISVRILDRNLKILWANHGAMERTDAHDSGSLCLRPCYEAFFEKSSPCENCPALRTIESSAAESIEIRLHRGSEQTSYLVTTTPLYLKGTKAPPVIIEMIQEFTSHMKADDELRRLNEFNREIIENAPVAIFTVNKEGEFSSVNPALAVLSGLGEKAKDKLLGFNWLKNPYTIKCGLAQHIKDGLEGKPFQLWDFPFINYWGEPQYIYFKGVPVNGKDGSVEGLLCIIEETTEIVRTRAQLIQEAKMSFVGRLAAGIAHELNNPLATITANSELAKELIENSGQSPLTSSDLNELKDYVDTIEEQAYRCTRTIRNLLEVTRKKDFGARCIHFKTFIEELLNGINFQKMRVKLVREIPPHIPDINGDPEALRQVIQNVISNAVDALEGTENSTVWIRVITRSESMVEVAVEDNGIGIPENMVDLIFEPFFTTKEPKKGTGLGLTLCYDFLQRMGGSIEVHQRPGGGSIFKIALPVHGGRR